MRLFLIPISTRRTLIYGQRLNKIISENPSRVDKVSGLAAKYWLQWEKSETKWKRKITEGGNKLFNRIPFEEWGLKSIPPLSARRRQREVEGVKVDVIFPSSIITPEEAPKIIQKLSTERTSMHRRRLIWSVIGLPITAPIGLLPLVPNIPFFYLLYRAFSHWKALSGAKHLEYLIEKDLLHPKPSTELDSVYRRGARKPVVDYEKIASEAEVKWKDAKDAKPGEATPKDSLLIQEDDAKEIASAINVPSLALETERACRQVADQLGLTAQIKAQKIRLKEALKEDLKKE